MTAGWRAKALDAFGRWFQSDAGVFHCFVVFTGGVVVELVFPHLDPDHFWYLFILTWWSAFTCNALANSSKHDSDAVARVLAAILHRAESIESITVDERTLITALGEARTRQAGPKS